MPDYLSRDNPRLIQLEDEYKRLGLFDISQWRAFSDSIDIQKFRGEPGYLSQMWFGMTEDRYQNTYDLAVHQGLEPMLKTLGEDDAFGAITFKRGNTVFSRDLLDSVFEIGFLKDCLDLFWSFAVPFNVLDIGAGYGRFAYRLTQAHPLVKVVCTDGVPLSTFLCEYYLTYRKTYRSAIQLPELMPSPENGRPKLGNCDDFIAATNHYSFSEMPLASVRFWLKLCADLDILYFFLVPHSGNMVDAHFVTSEPDGTHLDYYPLFEEFGYKLIERRHKFPPNWPKPLIYNTEYLLLKRGGV